MKEARILLYFQKSLMRRYVYVSKVWQLVMLAGRTKYKPQYP